MKVMLTGGTGFVGSHAVEHLLAAGHELRLLVRSPEKAARVLGGRGVGVPELVVGDMADESVVRKCLRGCDAVIHAAATVEISRATELLESNAAGNRNVLGLAAELGLDPIVYTSTVAVMFPPVGPRITVDDPVTMPGTAYGRSKAEGELFARELQARGAPVTAVYPSGVYGPDDPGPSAGIKGVRDRLKYGCIMTTGGNACIDVRDLAQILCATLAPGQGPRRFMAGGNFLTWREEADLFDELTGRKVRRFPGPPRLVRAAGHLVDLLRFLRPSFDYPLTHEASIFVTKFVPCDNSRTEAELGVRFRPARETLADCIRWMVEAGHLEAEFAGKLAPGSS